MFAHGDASHPLQLTARGKPCKILLATEMVASYASIVVRKDLYDSGITSLDKLAAYKRPDGAKPIVAATAIGSGTWVFGTYVFEARGLADKGELGSGRRAEHHVSVARDQSNLTRSWRPPVGSSRLDKGLRQGDLRHRPARLFEKDFGGTLPVLVIHTLQDTIDQDKATVQAFVNAIYRAMRWFARLQRRAAAERLYAVRSPITLIWVNRTA